MNTPDALPEETDQPWKTTDAELFDRLVRRVEVQGPLQEPLGRVVKLARKWVRLTQVELAARLGKSLSTVSAAETGRMQVGDSYVRAVLKACGLPEDWKPAEEWAEASQGRTQSLELCAKNGGRIAQILLNTPKDAESISLGDIRSLASNPEVSDDELFEKIVRLIAE